MNTYSNTIGFRKTLLNERKRLSELLAETIMVYNHSPQLLEARQRGAAPDVYHHYRRKASHAKIGAYAMWFICLSLGGAFTILSYDIPGLPPLVSDMIVLFIWAVVTLLIGVGTEKIVEFGLEIDANSPFSATKAIRGILVCGLIFILSFAGLLLLRTLISLPLLIALQAIFEVSAISAGSFFKAIEDFYSELPDLRDRITSLEASIDKIDAQLAILDSDASIQAQPLTINLHNQHVGVPVTPSSPNGHSSSNGLTYAIQQEKTNEHQTL